MGETHLEKAFLFNRLIPIKSLQMFSWVRMMEEWMN